MKKLGAILLLTPILIACGSDEKGSTSSAVSVDSGGNCASSFISDYNNIVHETRMLKLTSNSLYSQSEIEARVSKMNNACNKFFTSHPNVSCKAEVDYVVKQVHSSDLKVNCDAIGGKNSPSANISKDNAGNCTQNLISSYNEVVRKTKDVEYNLKIQNASLRDSLVKSSMKSLDLACKDLFSKHSGVSCKATSTDYTRKETTLWVNDLKKLCDLASEGFDAPKKDKVNDQIINPSNGEDVMKEVKSSLKKEKVKVTVVHGRSLNELVQDDKAEVYLGSIVKNRAQTPVARGEYPYCKVTKIDSTLPDYAIDGVGYVSDGQVLKVSEVVEWTNKSESVIKIKLSDRSNLQILCKGSSERQFNLLDIELAFLGILKIEAVK